MGGKVVQVDITAYLMTNSMPLISMQATNKLKESA
jgi:hypothetical protein